MDDQKFGKYLNEKIGEYTDPQFDEDNWENLLFRMDNLPKSPRSFIHIGKDFFRSIALLLLLSNLVFLGLLLQKQNKSENLLYQLEQTSHKETVARIDTVYVIREFSTISQPNTTFDRRITHDLSDQTSLRSTILNSSNDHELLKPVGSNESNHQANSQDQNAVSNNESILSSKKNKNSELYTGKTKHHEGQSSKLKEVQKEYEFAPADQIEKRENSFLKHLRTTNVYPGIGYAFFGMNSGYGPVNSKGQIGIFLDWEILMGLRISTGGIYYPWDFKIDDHNGAVANVGKQFPFIERVPQSAEIHEIAVLGHGIELPLGLKYSLQTKKDFNPFIQAGLYFKGNLMQNFIYQIQEGDSFSMIEGRQKNINLEFGGFQAILGSEFNFAERLKPQISIFFQQDIGPTGIEQNKYRKIGLMGSFWLMPNK